MTDTEHGGGAVSAPMAVAVLALLTITGLGIDGVRAAQGLADADSIAEEAARAAGQSLDPAALARGQIVLDPGLAVLAGREHLAAAGATGTVTVAGPGVVRVEARLTRPTVLLGLIGRSEIISVGTAEGRVLDVAPDGSMP